MKKILLSAMVLTLVITLLASCGASRKTGCPAVASTSPAVNPVQS